MTELRKTYCTLSRHSAYSNTVKRIAGRGIREKPQKSALFKLRKHFSSNNKRVECSFTLLSGPLCDHCVDFEISLWAPHFNMTLTSVLHFKGLFDKHHS